MSGDGGGVASLSQAIGGTLFFAIAAVSVGLFLDLGPKAPFAGAATLDKEASPADAASREHINIPATTPAKPDGEPTFPRLDAVPRETGARVWKSEELALHKGEDTSLPLLLTILGEVYDVGDGARFYAPGKGYHELAGADHSRAFAEVSLREDEEMMSKVEDLPQEDLQGILGWHQFYRDHETYRFVGFQRGRYFDARGTPTEENLRLQALRDAQAKSDDYKKKLQKRFMGCNTRFTGGKQSFEVWCDDSYHPPGSVPLHLYFKTRAPTENDEPPPGWCACLPPHDRAKADADSSASAGMFRLVDYKECEVGKQRCQRPKGAPLPLLQ